MSSPVRMVLPRLGVLLALLALATYGLLRAYALPPGAGAGQLTASLSQALQMMVGRFPSDLEGRPLPLVLELARIALPLALVWAVVSLAWREAGNPLRRSLARVRGGHLVLAGDGPLAGPLAVAERRRGRPVMVWTNNAGEAWVRRAADLGATWAERDGPAAGAGRLGLEKARIVLIAGDSDADNLALADAAIGEALKVRQPGSPLTVIARVDDPDLRLPLERRFDLAAERRSARLRFASLPDIAARRLFVDRPIDRFVRGESTAPVVYLLGLSPIVERYALRLLAGVHLRDGEKPTLVVLSASEARDRAAFFARWPGAEGIGRIHFHTAALDDPRRVHDAVAQAADDHGPPTAVVVDAGDAPQNVAAGLAAAAALTEGGWIAPPIYVHAARAEVGGDARFTAFAGPEDFADPELLLQERLDALAQSIHEFYFEGRLDEGDQIGSRVSMQEWDMLPEAVRDDNRLVADCYELKLRDVGARAVATQGAAGAGLQLSADDTESLSRAEHDRWLAAKLLDGWAWGEVRDDARKLHPDIVAYDQLTEPRKDLDREQVRVIGRLLARSGRRAVRDLVILVDGDVSGDAAPIVEGFAAAYPDRTPVLLGAFEAAQARRLLASAAAAGAPVQLVLTQEPAITLANLPAAERDAATALLQGADRLYALASADWPPERRQAFMISKADARIAAIGRPPLALPTVVMDGARVVSAPWR